MVSMLANKTLYSKKPLVFSDPTRAFWNRFFSSKQHSLIKATRSCLPQSPEALFANRAGGGP